MLRILLVLPFALAVYEREFTLAFVVFFVAGLSDAIDGFLARQFNWHSRFGAIADPLADKLLLMTAYLMLAWIGEIPLWLAALVLGRDLIIVGGALLYHYVVSEYAIKPSFWGKLCTALQIVFVLLVIIDLAFYVLPEVVRTIAAWSVVAATLLSGAHYLWVWGRKAAHSEPHA